MVSAEALIELRHSTPAAWVEIVERDLPAFLRDHATNERKVSGSALAMAVQHPTRPELVRALIEVAQEELEHFRQVAELLYARGETLGFEQPDPYMAAVRKAIRNPSVDGYLLDRLLLFGIIEARGQERFGMLADGLADPELRAFYGELVKSEARHAALYLRLARTYFPRAQVVDRLSALLDVEAGVLRELPLRPALH